MKEITCFSKPWEKKNNARNPKCRTSTQLTCNAKTFILSLLVIVYNITLYLNSDIILLVRTGS